MGEISFKTERFFDLSGFAHAEVFARVENVWEVLPKLNDFIESCFADGSVGANYKDRKDVLVGAGTTIEEGVFIRGKAIIGKDCFIGHGAYLRDGVILGDNVHIGHGCEIKQSIILNDSAVAHLSYIGDSMLGGDINVGGGATTANFRFDKKPIRIKVGNETIDTGLVKFGAVIGDGAMIGVNAVLNPGTILGKRCIVYPLVSVFGVHEDGETIR